MEHCKTIQSRPSSSTTRKYDVFVSFRGEDIRNKFVGHLFAAFQRKGIVAFRDDRHLMQGDHISTELEQAIEASQVLIAVFSKHYATSTWCLRELAKFVDCIIKLPPTGQIVLPVFYDVSPSEVRKQSGEYFGKAFAELEERFKDNLEMVQRWREALILVADFTGQVIQNQPEHTEIEKIVERVINEVGYEVSSFDGLVGMHSRVEQLEKFLDLNSDVGVRVVGIHGMGGIGKTVLARAVYDRNFKQYGASCFIDDISRVYRDDGPIGAQKQLICQTLKEENQVVWNVSEATRLIKTRLRHLKSFIVLDNVDKIEQLEKLGLSRGYLGAGSKIIIISRNLHILNCYGVDEVYGAKLLDEDEAHQLFCIKAFKYDYIMRYDAISREYEELTRLILRYAQGLPLAIEVLGSFLYGKSISEWKSAMARLRDSPNKDIMDVLQISFDGLEPSEKEIFLDIACFFQGYSKEFVEKVLGCCRFEPTIGIKSLVDKSLITIRHSDITMHDKLRELGMNIARQNAPNEPRKWSRLWLLKDYHNVMYLKMAMDNLEAITLVPYLEKEVNTTWRAEALSKMNRLRLLILNNATFSGSLSCLSSELCYLEWGGYPFTYFPSNCQLIKLVELHLPVNSIKQLWEGIKPMDNLKIMDLSHSKNLTKTPDFSGAPNLVELNLGGCKKLVHIHPSIGLLRNLVYLNLSRCTNLRSLPNSICDVSSLEVVNFQGCSKLFHSEPLENARHGISDTATMSTSSVFERLKLMLSSQFFNSTRHNDSLTPSSLFRLHCLRELNLSYCNLFNIPGAMASLSCLERLNLRGNNFTTVTCLIKELPRLICLDLDHCKQLTYLSEFPLSTVLPTRCCSAELRMFNCPKLVEKGSWSSISHSWMIQYLKVHKESSPPIAIVIPGDQIPSWFNRQHVGDSIAIEPIPDMDDSNWIGFAFCAAFVLPYDRGHQKISCKIHSENVLLFSCVHVVAEITETDGVAGELVHLCLLYFSVNQLMETKFGRNDLNGLSFKMYAVLPSQGYKGIPVEVRNCGMRVVFKHDFE